MRRCSVNFIEAGYCRHCEAMTIRGGKLRPAIFPALAGLLIHPAVGAVLFDTGYDPAFFTATQPVPQRLYRWLTPPVISPQTIVSAQLARFGLVARDIKTVVLSHFHADHIAGLQQFPDARIICSRQGLDAARKGGTFSALRAGVLRALIPPDIDARARFFEDCPQSSLPAALHSFEEGADVFGDSSLMAIPLPGHAAGQFGIVAQDTNDQLHFLAADAAWSSRAIRENRPPPGLTTALLGSTRQYRQTLTHLHKMSLLNEGIIITPSHCTERAAAIAGHHP